jgi:glycosyltransferase involved in cell wall biosynthesis
MKVLHIIVGLDVGGAEKVLIDLLKYYPNQDVEHIVLSMKDRGALAKDIEALSIPIYTLGMQSNRPSLMALWRLRKLIRQLSPDVIQGWMYHGNLFSSIAAWFQPKVCVYWAVHHSLSDLNGEKRLTRWVIKSGRLFSRFVDRIIYVSRTSAAQHEQIGYPKKKSVVIPNGIYLERFNHVDGQFWKQQLGIGLQQPVISFIARYHPVKDHTTFFQAIAEVMKRHKHVCFVLAGREVTESNTILADYRAALPYPENVYLLGECDNVHEILSASTLAVNCSKSEAFPISIAEAMASSVPCVVTDVGDSRYLLGGNGFIVPAKDSKALAKAIQSLLAFDANVLGDMGKMAKQRITDHFSLQAILKQYHELYQSTECLRKHR